MPKTYRRALRLRHIQGLTIREAAETVGLATSTVKPQLHWARLWLSERASEGRPPEAIPEERHSDGMRRFGRYVRWMALRLLGRPALWLRFAEAPGWSMQACYGNGELHVNAARLGEEFFSGTLHERIERWSDLIIHEFAHERESNHLSEGYYRACTRLGGKLARLMLEEGYAKAGPLALHQEG
jgi:hypothetical protein